MSEFTAEYDFDYRNFNTVVREIFIHHANQLTGFDPDAEADLSEKGMSVPVQVEVFNLAQEVAQKVREVCTKAYRREITKQEKAKKAKIVAPLPAYALVIYERYVKQGLALTKALKLTSGKHSQLARDLYEQLEPEQPVDMAQVEKLLKQLKPKGKQ